MDFDVQVKLAIYRHFAETGQRPTLEEIASRVASSAERILAAYRRLRTLRVLVLEEDGVSIRMAPPFSGIPTQYLVVSHKVLYYANCAWDTLGVPAALHQSAIVHSRCEQSGIPLKLKVELDGPEPCDWVFHSLVPAAKWWDDIVFT
ncbi:MAG: hypothetical protein D6748_06045 [Calditrichaeota bacterium]|nr:MAG: hypothetical protein D6748_06045 [Calditrichota bacterium]